jgi:peptidoglycan-associated lipoprotein
MVHRARSTVPLMALLALVVISGCSKRPSSIQAVSPAPSAPPAPAPARDPATQSPPLRPADAPRSTVEAQTGPAVTPAPRPSPPEFTTVAAVKDIHFDFDRYDIPPGEARILDANAEWMNSNPDHLVLILGHSDERGTNEYNLALGERRAKAAFDYLTSRGVVASRMTVVSYGEEQPLCRRSGEDCWRQNRRAQFLVKPR